MKINTDIFLLGTSIKENKQKEQYAMLSIADTEGMTFSVLTKDIEQVVQLQQFTKYNVDLSLKASKYGLSLTLEKVN